MQTFPSEGSLYAGLLHAICMRSRIRSTIVPLFYTQIHALYSFARRTLYTPYHLLFMEEIWTTERWPSVARSSSTYTFYWDTLQSEYFPTTDHDLWIITNVWCNREGPRLQHINIAIFTSTKAGIRSLIDVEMCNIQDK